VRCVGPTGLEECAPGPDELLVWSEYSACPTGQVCDAGACTEVQCDIAGARSCIDAATYKSCEPGADGLAWSAPVACPDDQVCAGAGLCGVHGCKEVGASECSGAAATSSCVVGDDGFRTLAEAQPCPDDELCGPDGTCGAHQCGPKGSKACGEGGGVVTCTVGGDGFLVPSEETPCPPETICREGACGVDGCEPDGALECLDETSYSQCTAGADGFLTWSEPTACEDPAICVKDACLPHECPGDGATGCEDETHTQICQADEDGVLKWKPVGPCDGGQLCKGEGQCGEDECPLEGVVTCESGGALQTCVVGESGFLTFTDPQPCADGQVCKSGKCGVDDCLFAEATCIGDAVAICEADEDGFLSFGEPTPCQIGKSCVGNGSCAVNGELEVWDEPALGRPGLAALTAGGLAVVWASPKMASFPVMLRRFDANGEGVEDALDVSGPVGVNLPFPSVVAAPNLGEGGVIVAWLSGGLGEVHVRQVPLPDEKDIGIVQIDPVFSLPANPFPTAVPISKGLVAALRIEGPVTPAAQLVYASITDGKNEPSPAVLITEPTASGKLVTGLHSAAHPAGGLWAGWTIDSLVGIDVSQQLRLRKVPADGKPKAEILVVDISGKNPANPSVAVAEDGSVLAAFDAGEPDSGDVFAQLIGPDDQLDGGVISVNSVSSGLQERPSAAVVPGAGWYVVWQGPDVDEVGIYARLVGQDGKPIGSDTAINLTTKGSQAGPRAVTLTDTRIAVAWRDGVGFKARIKVRWLTVP